MPIAPHDLHAIAEIATGSILNSLLAGIAIAAMAWAVTQLFGRYGSGTRFAVWFSALVAVVILPWLSPFGASHTYAAVGISRSAVTLPISFALYLFASWAVVAAFGLLRVGVSLYRLRQLRSTCTPVDLDQLSSTLQASLVEMQAHRRVTLCSSNAVRVPAALGYFRPIVVFPAWTLQEIAAAELEAILLHELAHLRRWDDWTNLAQKIVKAIFFFHPAVWFIESRLSLEREMACDDAVLAANFSPRAYAESLLGLAEKSFLRRGVQLAQAAVSQVRQLKMRIVEILRMDRQGSSRVWRPAIALMAVAGIVGAYSVSHGPHLIAFSSGGPQIASTVASTNADSLLADAQLRPVNVRFFEAASRMNGVGRSTPATRVRLTWRIAPKPQVAHAERSARPQLFDDEIAAPPRMVLSNFTIAQSKTQNTATPSAVLVVVQGEQFGINGPVFWRLTIVQLTAAQQHALTGGVPRKI